VGAVLKTVPNQPRRSLAILTSVECLDRLVGAVRPFPSVVTMSAGGPLSTLTVHSLSLSQAAVGVVDRGGRTTGLGY
jgi:hypothetical protein